MTRLNYASRKMCGIELGYIVSRDLKDKFLENPRPRIHDDRTIEIDLSKHKRKDGVVTGADGGISPGPLTDKGFKAFIRTLTKCLEYPNEFQLLELYLSRNELTVDSLLALAKVIKLSANSLRDLDLSHNKIKIETPNERTLWERFLKSFAGCAMLKRVNFGGNPLGSFGMELLAKTYIQSPIIVERDRQGKPYIKGLRSIPYLILADVDFSPAAVIHLASMLTIQQPRAELRRYLPDTKPIVTNEEAIGICESIIWLPNEHLSSKKRDFLICAAKMAQPVEPRRRSDVSGARKLQSPERNSVYRLKEMQKYQAKREADYFGHSIEAGLEAVQAGDMESCILWEAAFKTVGVCKLLLIEWNCSSQPTTMTYAAAARGCPDSYDLRFPLLSSSSVPAFGPRSQKFLDELPSAWRNIMTGISQSVKPLSNIPQDRWYRDVARVMHNTGLLTVDQHLRIMTHAKTQDVPVTPDKLVEFLTTSGCLMYR